MLCDQFQANKHAYALDDIEKQVIAKVDFSKLYCQEEMSDIDQSVVSENVLIQGSLLSKGHF